MNKRGIRAFSLGMIFAVSVIGSYYFYFAEGSSSQLNTSGAKTLLQKNGYKILTANEYKNLKEKNNNTRVKNTPSKKKQLEQSKINQKKLPKNQSIQQGNKNRTYRLQVVSGMTSGDIAGLLVEHKIIENGQEFQQFLITHQYQTKVQLGTYDLTNKMNYEQIAKKITKTE